MTEKSGKSSDFSDLQEVIAVQQDAWRHSRSTRKAMRTRAWAIADSLPMSSLSGRWAAYEFCYETLRRTAEEGKLSIDEVESWGPSPARTVVRPGSAVELTDSGKELQRLLLIDQGRWRRSYATRKRLRRRAAVVAGALPAIPAWSRHAAYAFCYETLRRMVAGGTLAFGEIESWELSPSHVASLREKLGVKR